MHFREVGNTAFVRQRIYFGLAESNPLVGLAIAFKLGKELRVVRPFGLKHQRTGLWLDRKQRFSL